MATSVSYDAARAEAFASRLTEAYNDASLALMISVGHRTGLFDAFAGIGAVTSADSRRSPASTSATCASGSAP